MREKIPFTPTEEGRQGRKGHKEGSAAARVRNSKADGRPRKGGRAGNLSEENKEESWRPQQIRAAHYIAAVAIQVSASHSVGTYHDGQ